MTDALPAPAGATRDRTWEYRCMGDNLLLSQADIALLDALKPRCAVCNRQVNSLTWRRDISEPWVVFTVHCHGATEDTVVPFSRFHEIMAGAIQGAKAFGEPILTHEEAFHRAALKVIQEKKAFDND